MSQVRIYNTVCWKAYMMSEQGERMTLEPWSGNNEDYAGESDEGTLYELPEGCKVTETVTGSIGIYKGNTYCDFFSENGVPMILLDGQFVELEKVGA